ncbi:hypothetical protein CEQ90_08160 [Lewinellaceae bacterium SD302]|nr:hypothetical protein CEQ90_08160 [Lewinellaceae bacterium SD302]
MFTFITNRINSFVQGRKAAARTDSFSKLLFAEYWTYGLNPRKFRALAREFSRDALPLIINEVETKIGKKAYQGYWLDMRYCWFELWLIWKTGRQMRTKVVRYNYAGTLPRCAELHLLRRRPWQEIVRNVPVSIWTELFYFAPSEFIHLAAGFNVRRHPTYAHFTRKMAHLFHNDTGGGMISNRTGVSLFMQTLGYRQDDHNWAVYALMHSLAEYPLKKDIFIHLRPLAERLIDLFDNPHFNKNSWDITREYIVDNWSTRSKIVLKNLRNPEQLERAANRHFNQRIAKIDLAALLKDFGYESDTRWPARNHTDWNLRTQRGWYRMVELQTAEEIVHEGAVMHHCVGDYLEECLKGEERICSLRFRATGKRKWRSVATISVANDDSVSEAKGILNAELNDHYQRLVEAWAVGEKVRIDWNAIID